MLIDNRIINKLVNRYNDFIDNETGKKYKYISKGREGVIFEVENKIIKIFKEIDINKIMKEFYLTGIFNEIKIFKKYVVKMYEYYLSLDKPVIIMEKMDGTLEEWGEKMVKNIFNIKSDEIDLTWKSMIFQIVVGFKLVNNLGVLHNDAKPVNILYKIKKFKPNDKSKKIHFIEGVKYEVPNIFKFKIADFGAAQILKYAVNEMDEEKLLDNIKKRRDMYDLSRFLMRIIVNHAMNVYSYDDIVELIKKNTDIDRYYQSTYVKIDKDMYISKLPYKVKINHIIRGVLYYCYEHKILDEEDIIKKYNLVMPSKVIKKLLDNICNTNISNVLSLFDEFKIE